MITKRIIREIASEERYSSQNIDETTKRRFVNPFFLFIIRFLVNPDVLGIITRTRYCTLYLFDYPAMALEKRIKIEEEQSLTMERDGSAPFVDAADKFEKTYVMGLKANQIDIFDASTRIIKNNDGTFSI